MRPIVFVSVLFATCAILATPAAAQSEQDRWLLNAQVGPAFGTFGTTPNFDAKAGFRTPAAKVFAQPVKTQSYTWSAEVLMFDEKGKTVTVRAPYLEHISRYIGEFTRGDKVMLNWATPRPGETEAVRYVGRHDASSAAKWGYVLPVEFVSADTTERRLTFTVALPSKALKALKRIPSGGWIKVTTPFDQPNETATIVAVESTQPAVSPS
jgi:hypothetical protein